MHERLKINEIDPRTIFKTDPEGNLLPEGGASKIDKRYEGLIEEIKTKIIELLGTENIVSIYVSGSVATGTADANSDIDIRIIMKERMGEELELSKKQQIKAQIEKRGLVTKIDISFASVAELVGAKPSFRKRFIHKLLSVCVYGEDLNSQLPNFKADKRTAVKLSDNIRSKVDETMEKLRTREDPIEIKNACRWIMKMILRNSFLLVIDNEKKFTISLDTMAKLFKKHFPQKSAPIEQVLDLCNNPTDDKKKIAQILADYAPWLVEQLEILKSSYQKPSL